MRGRRKLIAVAAAGALAVASAGCGEDAAAPSQVQAPTATPTPEPAAALPADDAPIPRGPRTLAETLISTTDALNAAIDRWRKDEEPPRDVVLLAHYQQRIYRLLTDRRGLSRRTLAAVPRARRAEVRDNVLARRELGLITSVRRGPPPKVRVGPAEPADVLRRHYRAARRRFGVAPALLAAVNFVESAFGRVRNRSVSGARGPMQFMPATWRAYGLGGDIHDARDAIMGAANYLHASGAPRDERRALYHYNPSLRYVSAISRYARRIRADWRTFYAYYAWQVYIGGRRVDATGAP
jgi:membrane-bound lytic murein transglycosylase B